jgi:hypothetical protein
MDARGAVLSVPAKIGEYADREKRRKHDHFNQNNPPGHFRFAPFLFLTFITIE